MIRQELLKIIEELQEIETYIHNQLKKLPPGSIRISRCKKNVQFYHYKSSNKKSGTYISKKNLKLLSALSQKRYLQKLLKQISHDLELIYNFLAEYDEYATQNVFFSMPTELQAYITPIILPLELKIKKWNEMSYTQLDPIESDSIILTNRGERVRSKSEKILADALDYHGIPYHYEQALELKNGNVIYPDFTILSLKTGDVVYWEHHGRMGDSNYANRTLHKINMYSENNIIVGKNLILTFESDTIALSTPQVETYIKEVLLP